MKTLFDRTKFDIKVSEIMTRGVITVAPHTSAEVCAKLMVDNRIGSVVVIDSSDKLLGIITKENLLRHVIAQNATAETVKAFEIMSAPVITAKPSVTITEAMNKMFKESIRHLVVIDENNKIVGICTDTDIFKVVPTLILLEQEYLKLIEEEEEDKEEVLVSGYCDDCGEYSDSLVYIDGQYKCPQCAPEDLTLQTPEL
ncbi:MAG: CBS domain-containing protein [Candidatus Heimdallarchaeaceae archaeon]